MELMEKLRILSDAAKYDVSCSSSGSDSNRRGKIGSISKGGICHTWSADGRCISLLKILFTNKCIYDCVYCRNRRSNKIERCEFTVEEVVKLTIEFYKRNYIEGLFLSSGIIGDKDKTQGLLVEVAKILRKKYGFGGYIHLKGIPGARKDLLREAGKYADRVSLNIELPSEKSLNLLAPNKSKKDIILPMNYLGEESKEYNLDKKKRRIFMPGGQTTQMIIGATPEKDADILRVSENLYEKFGLKRVYYSAYTPVNVDKKLPSTLDYKSEFLREHRLYQGDWLIRLYGFKSEELFKGENESLSLDYDPKVGWALENIDYFPVDIIKASYEMLLRVPGIGLKSSRRILEYRRQMILSYESLKKIGVALKRAKYFITIGGRMYDEYLIDREMLELKLSDRLQDQLKLF